MPLTHLSVIQRLGRDMFSVGPPLSVGAPVPHSGILLSYESHAIILGGDPGILADHLASFAIPENLVCASPSMSRTHVVAVLGRENTV